MRAKSKTGSSTGRRSGIHALPTPPRRSSSSTSVSPLDKRRYFDFRSGLSAEEIAARDNIKLSTVLSSIDRMKSYAAEFSQESTDLATRELYMSKLSDAASVLSRALHATRHESTTRMITRHDPLTGESYEEAVVVDEVVPDLNIQLKGMDALQRVLASVQPKNPLVQLDNRTQNNFAVQAGQGQGAGPGQGPGQPLTLSAEALIRKIRAERGLALPAPEAESAAIASPLVERDMELEQELLEEQDEQDEQDPVEERSLSEDSM